MYDRGVILGPDGRPFTAAPVESNGNGNGAVHKTWGAYVSSLRKLHQPPIVRAGDPLHNHPWVYAAAVAIAINASSVPFVIYGEQQRGDAVVTKQYGAKRRSLVRRHRRRDAVTRSHGLIALEEHPFNELFYVTGPQTWFLVFLSMAIWNEAFLLCLDENDEPTSYLGGQVYRLGYVCPMHVTERLENNRHVGWSIGLEKGQGYKPREVSIDTVIQPKLPDPMNPIRGLDPLSALAATIRMEMAALTHNTALTEGGNDPGGVLVYEGQGKPFKNEDEKTAFEEAWHQRNSLGQTRKTGILFGGWKYMPVGYSPRETDFRGGREINREEILGVIGTQKSVLSLTDGLNYATQLSQDRNFWEKRIVHLMKAVEVEMDRTLFFTQPDNVVGLFDLSTVDALRLGVQEKVDTVIKLTSPTLHLTPRMAFDMVGLDVETYEGNDVALVPQGLMPVDQLLAGSAQGPLDAAAELLGPEATAEGDDAGDAGDAGNSEFDLAADLLGGEQRPTKPKTPDDAKRAVHGIAGVITRIGRQRRRELHWKQLMRVLSPHEDRFKGAWRAYIRDERVRALSNFDAVVRTAHGIRITTKQVESPRVLLDVGSMSARMREKFRPLYTKELEDVMEMTVKELGGIAVFDLDSPSIVDALDRREDILVGSVPETLQHNVRESIRKGVERGETVQQIRDRVARVYDIAASSAKALQVARTETAGFMNDAREAMFREQGFEKRDWITAGDEHVRPDHVTYGDAEPMPAGFNYLSLVGKDGEGILEYPGDPRAPADQVINCRCVQGVE